MGDTKRQRVLHNCWTCAHWDQSSEACCNSIGDTKGEKIDNWIALSLLDADATPGNEAPCRSDADGCPGWEIDRRADFEADRAAMLAESERMERRANARDAAFDTLLRWHDGLATTDDLRAAVAAWREVSA